MDYDLQIIVSSKRRSIGIYIYPDARVKVRVPKRASQKEIEMVIQAKQAWIIKKVQFFKQNQSKSPQKKEYTSGEFFFFLGKQYQLIVIQDKKNKIELTENEILIYKKNQANTKNILNNWFKEQAIKIFTDNVRICFEIFSKVYSYPFPAIKVRKMKARWGSMSSKGLMTLNTNLIHTSIDCINYVIMHELCHLKHKNHGKHFLKLQSKFINNYKEIKKKLQFFSYEINQI